MSTIDDRNYRGKPIEPQMKQQWLDAMRDGGFVKITASLEGNGPKERCALGVLNDVMGWEQDYVELEEVLGSEGVDDVWQVSDGTYGPLEENEDFTRVADWIEQNIPVK